ATIQSSKVGESVGGKMQYAPAVTGIAYGQPRPTGMAPQPVPLGGGPDMRAFTADDEEMVKLHAERGAKAGGWSCELSKKRSIEEAFDSMWI
ncbi:Cdk-activating kinase assembly factor-like protein, partial [Thalictrum thalictroides]